MKTFKILWMQNVEVELILESENPVPANRSALVSNNQLKSNLETSSPRPKRIAIGVFGKDRIFNLSSSELVVNAALYTCRYGGKKKIPTR